jgi:subtilisin family serine protease
MRQVATWTSHQGPSSWIRRRSAWATACVAVAAAVVVAGSPAGAATPVRQPGAAGTATQLLSRTATVRTVTLVTGDVVRILRQPDGQPAVTLLPGPDGTVPQAAVTQVGGHLHVVPRSAVRLLATGQLSPDLFDVTQLLADGYDDNSTSTLPVIVGYGRGAAAASRAVASALPAAHRVRVVPLLGDVAFAADKKAAHRFWAALTSSPGPDGAPTGLADGATRVYLDGRVHVADDYDPLQQIHAPQAWAAGLDGTGVTVAVLDTGYDPTHPDLAGKVEASANFTSEPDVTDGNGHGTHVAGTIVGSGVASAGRYKGVSPGAELLVGKVLGSDGTGADSQVLAGMEWAVAQHADIVSMSLGGDTGDGTDPLEQAVDQLSATSPTLFVIAAGNNGSSPTTVTSPGAASAALTVGAVDGTDTMAVFSSRGPRLDGTVKPEIVAPGVDIVAARAAGTSLGNPVDQYYTSLSGTSMATPHVAGVAAILKEEHPLWDGVQLKAALVGSAVPVQGASAYDAGAGRVDALRAIGQSVLADPTLDLGFFAWPHTHLAPSTRILHYTNLAAAPVTLDIAVSSQDGVAAPPPGVSVSTSQVTVPARGQASVDVTVDPTVAVPGAYSGVVTATPVGGGQSVRTAVGYVLEAERYNVTVVVQPRTGTQTASHVIGLSSYADYSYSQRTLDASAGAQRVTFRVAPGRYATNVVSFGTAADNSQEGVLDLKPLFTVSKDTTVVLDERTTRLFGYRTDRAVVNDGAILNVSWAGEAGSTGAALAGSVDRLYARPMTRTVGGTVTTVLNMQLSQPEGLLTVSGDRSGGPIGLRPVTGVGQSTWLAPVPDIAGRFPLADAGSVAALRTDSVRGAVAVVAGSCADLTTTADALARAGAAAMVAYPGRGATCAGTITGTPSLPSFRTRPVDAARLLTAAGRQVALATNQRPAYVYDLAAHWTDRVPAGATLDGRGAHVATLVESYHSMGGTTAHDGVGLYENLTGIWPDLGMGIYGLTRVVPVPSVVTHFVSPGPNWERDVTVTSSLGGAYAVLYSPPAPVRAGTTTHDTWFGGPVVSGQSAVVDRAFGWGAEANRQGDTFFADVAPLVDSAGHTGAALYDGEYEATLTSMGQVLAQGNDPLWLNFVQVPPQRQWYRLDVTSTRLNAFWQRSSTVHTVWDFPSQTRRGDHAVLPLMDVGFDMRLSPMNTAPSAARWSFGLRLSMPRGVAAAPVGSPQVGISWNGGTTWQTVSALTCHSGADPGYAGEVTTCTVGVQNARAGAATVRVVATDSLGRAVQETVVSAYTVG